MKTETKTQLLFGMLILSVTALIGCTKERPFKALPKFEVLEKAQVGATGADFLLTASTGATARRSSASRPYWLGRTQRVQFQWNKDKLSILGVESDKRFEDNPTNMVPVMDIPVKYIAYRCAEDPFGECQNKEEKNEEIDWHQRPHVELDLEKIKLLATGLLPIELDNLGFKCFSNAGTQVLDSKFTPDLVTFTLQMTFQVHVACMGGNISSIEDLLDGTAVNVQRTYTFLRADKVLTPDYQPVAYEEGSQDQLDFGYFNSQYRKLDVDNRDVVSSKKTVMNRWHPEKKVVYYLNKDFDKYPEIKSATYKSFDIINKGLEEAGTILRMELRESSSSINASDMLKNMIILVDDPLATSTLGYGPTAADPKTGEIFYGRTVMYLGNMKKYLRMTYEDLLRRQKQEEMEEDTIVQLAKTFPQLRERAGEIQKKRGVTTPGKSNQNPGLTLPRKQSHGPSGSLWDVTNIKDLSRSQFSELAVDKRSLRDMLNDPNGVDLLEMQIRESAYPAEMFDFLGVVENGANELLAETQFKPWEQLSTSEKERVVEILLPFVWVPTFVHEVGHNLGLRHNFAGSEDIDNFYSPEELKPLGVKTHYRFSSVMDYPYGDVEPLRVLGKYDIAALRFGYSRKVETANGELLDIETTLEDLVNSNAAELKAFGYCTDEHVAPNPNCNRFDRGTNLIEITQHYIDSYEERYRLVHFRNQRADFSLADDHSLYYFNIRHMMPLRNMYERYESIKNSFNLAADDPAWSEVDFLKEVKASAIKAGDFFLDVLTTPDLTCVIARVDDPSQIAGVVKLADFSPRSTNCYDEALPLNRQFKAVAHFGKLFESKKASDNPNAYVDQIDVKGIWVNKLVAASMLLRREFGLPTMDRYTENPMQISEIREKAIPILQNIFYDQLSKKVTLGTSQGIDIKDAIEVPFKLGSQKIHRSMSPWARLLMGLPNGVTTFQDELQERIVDSSINGIHEDSELLDMFKVYGVRQGLRLALEEYEVIRIDNQEYFAGPGNIVGQKIMAQLKALQAGVSEIPRERLILLANLKQSEQMDKFDPQNESEEHALEMPLDLLVEFIEGSVSDAEYLHQTLRALTWNI